MSFVTGPGRRLPAGSTQSLLVPSEYRWWTFQAISDPDNGVFATNISSCDCAGWMSTFHVIDVTRSPLFFCSTLPAAPFIVTIVTPSGTSSSTDVVATLPSVGTRIVYVSVVPTLDS